MQNKATPEIIEKETIAQLTFNDSISVTQSPELMKELQKASILGNAERVKVAIVFVADSGLKRVETTIWAVGTKFICLKGGVWIPIHRIVEVIL
jgi:uncharacterized protein (UPF0248 family)